MRKTRDVDAGELVGSLSTLDFAFELAQQRLEARHLSELAIAERSRLAEHA
jgi:hypothetical protein